MDALKTALKEPARIARAWQLAFAWKGLSFSCLWGEVVNRVLFSRQALDDLLRVSESKPE